MKDLLRLIISNNRLKEIKKNILKLSAKETHYINNVMRLKNGDEINIVNGEGALWKGIKSKDYFIELLEYPKPILFKEKKNILIGIAVVVPKSGFEQILRMTTEIGVDFIQPLYSDHQVKKLSGNNFKKERFNLILNESVEQSERLWKPKLLESISIYDWIENFSENDFVSISVTRINNCKSLKSWLNTQNISKKISLNFWNVIGPEGGWSNKELEFFSSSNLPFVSLSETILRTSTAAIYSTSILNQWRYESM